MVRMKGFVKITNIAGGNTFATKAQAIRVRKSLKHTDALSNATIRYKKIGSRWIITKKVK